MLRDDSFILLEGVNASKMYLKCEYNISIIFKVSDILLFGVGDNSRSKILLRKEEMMRS
jgi:hypothetical protein